MNLQWSAQYHQPASVIPRCVPPLQFFWPVVKSLTNPFSFTIPGGGQKERHESMRRSIVRWANALTAVSLVFSAPGISLADKPDENGVHRGHQRRTTETRIDTHHCQGLFSIGDRVRTLQQLGIYSSSRTRTHERIGTQPMGSLGTIVGGPVFGDELCRYDIDFASSPDGWTFGYDRFAAEFPSAGVAYLIEKVE